MKIQNRPLTIALHVILLLFCVISLYPFLWMISSSFKATGVIMSVPPRFFPADPTLHNYKTIFDNSIGRSFFNSLFVSGIRVICTVYTSALLGYVFAKFDFKGKNVVFMCFIATMMVPWIVTIIPLYNVFNKIGLLDTQIAIIITGICSSYGIYLLRSFMYQVETSLIESARIDGCGELKIFNRIIMPLIAPALAALGIFTFLASWDDYMWPFLVISNEKLYTLTIALSKFAFKHYTIDYGPVIAGSVFAITPVVIVFLILQKQIVAGISLGSVKG